jgi:hypothetical protein
MAVVSPADNDMECQEQGYPTPRRTGLLTGRISVVHRGRKFTCIIDTKFGEMGVLKLHIQTVTFIRNRGMWIYKQITCFRTNKS